MAENLADEVIQASTDFGGRERAPMRLAEARITLGVIRAREGDLEGAVDQGQRALTGERKSLPSLLMVTRDLTKVLNDQYPAETQTQNYLLPRPDHRAHRCSCHDLGVGQGAARVRALPSIGVVSIGVIRRLMCDAYPTGDVRQV